MVKSDHSFFRLDDPQSKIAPGINFRMSEYYNENKRTLYKIYGIHFMVCSSYKKKLKNFNV